MKTIRRGDTGAEVLKAQRAINVWGAELEEDGSFGTKTETAVEQFQEALGLKVDGIIGAETWGELQLILNARIGELMTQAMNEMDELKSLSMLSLLL